MSNRNRAFDEVKGLLRNLDRSIDAARTRRLGPDEVEQAAQDLPETDDRFGESEDAPAARPAAPAARPSGDPAPVPGEAPSRRRQPGIGRARPLRRDGDESRQWLGGEEARRNDERTIG